MRVLSQEERLGCGVLVTRDERRSSASDVIALWIGRHSLRRRRIVVVLCEIRVFRNPIFVDFDAVADLLGPFECLVGCCSA